MNDFTYVGTTVFPLGQQDQRIVQSRPVKIRHEAG